MNREEQSKWITDYLQTVPREPGTDGVLIADGVIEVNDLAAERRSRRPDPPKIITVYGQNTGIGSGIEGVGPVGGLFVLPSTSGSQLEVVSASGSDTAAGTGMRTVRVVYERVDNSIGAEDLILNGTGAVSTSATDIIYVYPQYCHGLTFGSGSVAAGNVDIRIQGGGSVIERVPAGRRGVVTSARTRIPPGYTAFCFEWAVGVAGTNTAQFMLSHTWDHRTRSYLSSAVTRYSLDALTSGWFAQELPTPLVLPEKTQVEVSAVRLGGSDAAGAATFDLVLVRNT